MYWTWTFPLNVGLQISFVTEVISIGIGWVQDQDQVQVEVQVEERGFGYVQGSFGNELIHPKLPGRGLLRDNFQNLLVRTAEDRQRSGHADACFCQKSVQIVDVRSFLPVKRQDDIPLLQSCALSCAPLLDRNYQDAALRAQLVESAYAARQ